MLSFLAPEKVTMEKEVIQYPMSVGYLVMPPGTGKSYLHGRHRFLIEADSVIPCRSTPRLSLLRDRAKITGDWHEYDAHWATLLNEYISQMPVHMCVVMLPHDGPGRAANWQFLGAGCVIDSIWEQNISTRKTTIREIYHLKTRVLQLGGVECELNNDLENEMLVRAYNFYIWGSKNDDLSESNPDCQEA